MPNLAPESLQHPTLRHLAWLCRAPQLLTGPTRFDLAAALRDDADAILAAWDRTPEFGPVLLREPPARKLGHYFEALYACAVTELLGWELLARNLQISGESRTLGELDFVLRNPHTGELEHHEIAVKFYLGVAGNEHAVTRWYGPNSQDRLDKKTGHLRHHQCTLAERPETRARLRALGLDEPLTVRTFMPGYLFYPLHASIPAPPQADPAHLRGDWCYARDMTLAGHWVVLHKPHWLGPWVQDSTPSSTSARNTLAAVKAGEPPRLLAQLTQNQHTRRWHEQRRVFVVPDHWPGAPD